MVFCYQCCSWEMRLTWGFPCLCMISDFCLNAHIILYFKSSINIIIVQIKSFIYIERLYFITLSYLWIYIYSLFFLSLCEKTFLFSLDPLSPSSISIVFYINCFYIVRSFLFCFVWFLHVLLFLFSHNYSILGCFLMWLLSL